MRGSSTLTSNSTTGNVWSPGGQTTQSISVNTNGNYSVTVTGANGCTASASLSVTVPVAISVAVTSQTNISCNGGTNGSITAAAADGSTPYTYTIAGPTVNTTGASSGIFTGLKAGAYTVTAKDANNCTATATATLTEPAALSLSQTHTNVSCNGGNNGSINLTVSGGNTPYSYSWSNGATTEDISGLSAATYTVTVTTADGCTATTSVALTQPVVLATSETHTNVLCNGASTGAINLTVTGGTSPYTYSWSNGATSEDLSAIPAGTYTVTVTDANLCTATRSVTITQPAVLSLSETHVNVLCNGASTGSIDLSVTGGTSPYSYAWSNGRTTQDITGLAAGTYTVTATAQGGCTATLSVTITQPAVAIAIAETHTNVSCNGGNNGSIDITASGGTAPYTYAWSGGATSEDRSGLSAGTYTVTVKDANNCTLAKSITVTEPTAITLTESHVNVACNGASTGSINLTVSGGTSPYQYLWSNNATSEDLSGIPAGTYSVVVQDANGCLDLLDNISITQPAALAISETHTDIICADASNGAIDITVTGGAQPQTFTENFNTLATTGSSGTLPSGWFLSETGTGGNTTYTAGTGSDNTGDTYSYGSTGNSERALGTLLSGSVSPTIGAAFTNATGSTVTSASISYTGEQWRLGATSRVDQLDFQYSTNATSLSSGTWTDVNALDFVAPKTAGTVGPLDGNAVGNKTAIAGTISGLSVPNGATVWIRWTDLNASGADDGLAVDDFSATFNVPSYAYSWSNGAVTQDVSALTAGTYTVTVTDANNCQATKTVTIAVTDNTPPTVTCPAPVTVQCSAQVPAADPNTVSASDNCTVTSTSFVSDETSGSVSTEHYTITRTYKATDNNNNTATCTQLITVDDNTAPVADATTLADATGECSASITLAPTATDNCSGTITGTTSDALTRTTQGTSVVTWTFDDGHGNTSTQTQNIVVSDVTAPVADAATLADATGECSATINSSNCN